MVATTGASDGVLKPGPTVPGPVLVALDGSDLAARAIRIGIDVARRRRVPLVLLHAVPPIGRLDMYGIVLGEHDAEREAAGDAFLATVAAVRAAAPDVEVLEQLPHEEPARAITDAQHRLEAQLTVMASHGRSAVARMLRGSVTEAVLRATDGATLVAWPWTLPALGGGHVEPLGRRILVPLDGSTRTARVLPEAFRLARERAGEVVLLTVVDLQSFRPSRARALEDAIRRAIRERTEMLREAGIEASGTLVAGQDVPSSIISAARDLDCDMIAMTTHARGPVGRFVFGSVANHVAARAERPVLFTPPHDDLGRVAHLYPDVPAAVLDLALLPHVEESQA